MPSETAGSPRWWIFAALLSSELLLPCPGSAQLTGLGSAQLDQCAGPDACEEEDRFGSALAVGDFDGDGLADLAVGSPNESTGGASEAGLVQVFYGSSAGLSSARTQIFTQETPGIFGSSELGDHFGAALAAGDLNGDGFDELAIGAPDEGIGSIRQAGNVILLLGSSGGLGTSGEQEFDQSNLPTNGLSCSFTESPEMGDEFGSALAIGSRSLIIGAPGEDGFLPFQGNAGEVIEVTFFNANEPRGRGCPKFQDGFLFLCNGDSGPEGGDAFGSAVAARPLISNGVDVIASAPLESTSFGVSQSGVVNTRYNCLQQNGPLIGTEETNDLFGSALAVGNFGRGFRTDLAVGIDGETNESTSAVFAGAVAVVYAAAGDGVSDELATEGNQFFTQDSFQPESHSESNAFFGSALAAGDFDGDGLADLAAGAPGATVNGHSGAGAVDVLYSTAPDGGLSAARGQAFDQDHPASIPSVSESGDSFGFALAAGDFDGNGIADLAIGVPFETGAATAMGVVDVLYGLDRTTNAFGTVSFRTTAISVNEGSPLTFVVAQRFGGAVLSATVDHVRSGGTATPQVDFEYTPGTFTWNAGDLSIDIKTIRIIDDTTDEPDETLVLRLQNPSAGTAVGAESTVVVTIVDNDPPNQLFADGFESADSAKWSNTVS
ncbi:MAG: Calx-beta domain-containing protein [Thermoanaerobaculia bacterium]